MLSDEDLQRSAPFPLVRVAGAQVTESWQELRQRPGVVPVLLGNRHSVEVILKELVRAGGSWEAVAMQSRQLDVDAWIAERVSSEPEHFAIARLDVPWDGVPRPITAFLPSHDHRGNPYPELFFGLISVEEPWLVPTHLRAGGWGYCPNAVVHTAFYRRWYERYGAVLTTIADGVIEFEVERPPTTMEAARELAIEHFVFCPDVVHEGVRTIGNLAGSLVRSSRWYFWWTFEGYELL
jgi:hypothetical protein